MPSSSPSWTGTGRGSGRVDAGASSRGSGSCAPASLSSPSYSPRVARAGPRARAWRAVAVVVLVARRRRFGTRIALVLVARGRRDALRTSRLRRERELPVARDFDRLLVAVAGRGLGRRRGRRPRAARGRGQDGIDQLGLAEALEATHLERRGDVLELGQRLAGEDAAVHRSSTILSVGRRSTGPPRVSSGDGHAKPTKTQGDRREVRGEETTGAPTHSTAQEADVKIGIRRRRAPRPVILAFAELTRRPLRAGRRGARPAAAR